MQKDLQSPSAVGGDEASSAVLALAPELPHPSSLGILRSALAAVEGIASTFNQRVDADPGQEPTILSQSPGI